MFVKSDWGGWLLLAAVTVFPSMLYLTQPLSAGTPDKPVALLKGNSNPDVASQLNQDVLPRRLSALSEQPENNSEQILESIVAPGLTEVKNDGVDIPNDFSTSDDKYNSVASGQLERGIPRSDFVGNSNIQEQSGGVVDVVSVRASAAMTDETVVLAETTIADENVYLYLAEVDYPSPINENKCPPVYMQLNDYARNMRSAMGCDSE